MSPQVKQTKLSYQQRAVLYEIATSPRPLKFDDLLDGIKGIKTPTTSASLSRTLRRLEQRGLIRRWFGQCLPTEQGKELVRLLAPEFEI